MATKRGGERQREDSSDSTEYTHQGNESRFVPNTMNQQHSSVFSMKIPSIPLTSKLKDGFKCLLNIDTAVTSV